jgi:hypothetical protein
MRIGITGRIVLTAICLAGPPTAPAQAATDTGSARVRRRAAPVPISASYFGARSDSHLDTAPAPSIRSGRWGFPNPLLVRFLPGAGSWPAGLARWRSGRYLRAETANSGHYYGSPDAKSEAWYSYDGGAMQTIGAIGYFVVPGFLPSKAQEAFDREQDSAPPAGHGWPYHRW